PSCWSRALRMTAPPSELVDAASNFATTRLSNSKATWGIQSVAIEPPRRRGRKCLDNTVLAHFRDSMAALLHPSRIIRASREPEELRSRENEHRIIGGE